MPQLIVKDSKPTVAGDFFDQDEGHAIPIKTLNCANEKLMAVIQGKDVEIAEEHSDPEYTKSLLSIARGLQAL